MSGDLRQVLKAVDGSALSIQKAASSMMKHYDRTPAVAVTAWRDVLSTAQANRFLPLLYVCNEVLQISKRNRGAKFLEAFAGILGPCCIHICQRDPSQTEKVRRTVKIWGDRRVFSVRFVQDLLKGLEPYRNGSASAGTASAATNNNNSTNSSTTSSNLPTKPPAAHFVDSLDNARFSPMADPLGGGGDTKQSSVASSKTITTPETKPETMDDDDDDDIMQLLDQDDNHVGNDDSDEEDIFASGGESKLSINIDLDKVGTAATSSSSSLTARRGSSKRRRSSMESTGSQSSSATKRRRKRAVLSIPNLVDTLTRLTTLQQNFELSQLGLQKIDAALAKTADEDLEQLVGDELQISFQQTQDFLKQIQDQRKEIYDNAQERHVIERETVGYISWLEKALQLDEDDIQFCDKLEKEILNFAPIHAEIRKARDSSRAEEQRKQAEEAERERKRREAEETEKFRRAALQKKTEGGKGLVWNPATREYQELNTDESWRD